MNFIITCSFGEIIDKYTILKIKKNKTDDKSKLHNINKEIDVIKEKYPIVTDKENILFLELYKINSRLWILEDLIRYKSSIQEFDKQYIDCAESIHKENDKRAEIKKKINIQFDSSIVEEKIYNNIHEKIFYNNAPEPTQLDIMQLEQGKKCIQLLTIANPWIF